MLARSRGNLAQRHCWQLDTNRMASRADVAGSGGEASQERFWDRMAPRYARQPIKEPDAYEMKLEQVLQRLLPTDNVLEVGCGTGSTALVIARGVASVTMSAHQVRLPQTLSLFKNIRTSLVRAPVD